MKISDFRVGRTYVFRGQRVVCRGALVDHGCGEPGVLVGTLGREDWYAPTEFRELVARDFVEEIAANYTSPKVAKPTPTTVAYEEAQGWAGSTRAPMSPARETVAAATPLVAVKSGDRVSQGARVGTVSAFDGRTAVNVCWDDGQHTLESVASLRPAEIEAAPSTDLPRVVEWTDLQPGDLALDVEERGPHNLLLVRADGAAQWRTGEGGEYYSWYPLLQAAQTAMTPRAVLIARNVGVSAEEVRRAYETRPAISAAIDAAVREES